jgi:hypothetical protein
VKKTLIVWLWQKMERFILGVQAIKESWVMKVLGLIKMQQMSLNLAK